MNLLIVKHVHFISFYLVLYIHEHLYKIRLVLCNALIKVQHVQDDRKQRSGFRVCFSLTECFSFESPLDKSLLELVQTTKFNVLKIFKTSIFWQHVDAKVQRTVHVIWFNSWSDESDWPSSSKVSKPTETLCHQTRPLRLKLSKKSLK